MALVKGKGRQSTAVSRGSEGDDVFIRALRDGSLVMADWKQALILEGKAFTVTVGALTTPITGGGQGTIIDLDQPDFLLSIPSGTSIMPIRIEVNIQQPLLAADADEVEVLLAVDQDKAWDATGTWTTTPTIYNYNTLRSNASVCQARESASADTTDPVLDIELARRVITADDQDSTGVLWGDMQMQYEPKNPPVINGPAMLIIYWGGTVETLAFANVTWIELPTSVLT